MTEHVVDLEKLGDGVNAIIDRSLALAARPQRTGNILIGREMRKQRKVLECHADVAPFGGYSGHVETIDRERAIGGLFDAGDETQENGLPGPRWAEDHQDLAGLDRQRQIFQNLIVAKRFADRFELEMGHRSAFYRPERQSLDQVALRVE